MNPAVRPVVLRLRVPANACSVVLVRVTPGRAGSSPRPCRLPSRPGWTSARPRSRCHQRAAPHRWSSLRPQQPTTKLEQHAHHDFAFRSFPSKQSLRHRLRSAEPWPRLKEINCLRKTRTLPSLFRQQRQCCCVSTRASKDGCATMPRRCCQAAPAAHMWPGSTERPCCAILPPTSRARGPERTRDVASCSWRERDRDVVDEQLGTFAAAGGALLPHVDRRQRQLAAGGRVGRRERRRTFQLHPGVLRATAIVVPIGGGVIGAGS